MFPEEFMSFERVAVGARRPFLKADSREPAARTPGPHHPSKPIRTNPANPDKPNASQAQKRVLTSAGSSFEEGTRILHSNFT